jgi:hypothetical protein
MPLHLQEKPSAVVDWARGDAENKLMSFTGHDGFITNGLVAHMAVVRAVFTHWASIKEKQEVGIAFDLGVTFCTTKANLRHHVRETDPSML